MLSKIVTIFREWKQNILTGNVKFQEAHVPPGAGFPSILRSSVVFRSNFAVLDQESSKLVDAANTYRSQALTGNDLRIFRRKLSQHQ